MVAFAFVAGFAVWRWGLGALVAVAVAFTPDALTRAVDDGHLAFADRTLADPSSLGADERERVRAVFRRLDAVAPTARFGDYKLVFRGMPKMGPNAFALPGGTIVVTDELVRAFPEPDVIAGVLGHEIAHVAEAHGLSQVYRSLGTYLLVAIVVGDVGPVLDDLLLEGGLLLSLSHSREHEREADRIGVTLAAKAGYDPGRWRPSSSGWRRTNRARVRPGCRPILPRRNASSRSGGSRKSSGARAGSGAIPPPPGF